jgi:hypothetical protein
MVIVLLAIALFLLRYADPQRLLPYYERSSPLLWYFMLLAAESSFLSLWIRNGFSRDAIASQRSVWSVAAIAFALMLLAFVFVAATRIGLTPDSAYWGEPGAPILGWQFAVALLSGAIVFLGGLRRKIAAPVDLAIALSIWMLAVGIWLSVPTGVMKNSFYAPIDPPAAQPFPNSDAGYYDSMAESLMIGYPYQGAIPTRPLYIVFLAVLHLAVGEKYDLILAGQTLLLALIPVMMYFLGKRLHSRTAGVIVALFAIFREWNSVLISAQTRVSNTRTLLVDLPTLLLLMVACLFVVRWLEGRKQRDALIAGGLMGLLLLLRTQSLLLPPLMIGLGIMAYGLRNSGWRRPVLLFIVGLLAAAAPWLLHNYLQSGHWTLDAPFQYQVIASQYKYTGNLDLGAIDLKGKSLLGVLMAFAIKDPKFVAGFITTHFLATMIDSLLAMPILAPYAGIFAPLNLYWIDWQANLSVANIVILIGYLAVISVGFGAAWRRLRWAGLVPLAFALGYALTNGIGRFSGWRYDLPADWVGYFYFGIGAAELLSVLALAFSAPVGGMPVQPVGQGNSKLSWAQGAVLPVAFALLGGLPWIAAGMASPRYAEQTLPNLIHRLQSSPAVGELKVDQSQIESFLAEPQATLQIGRVLYPRYFSRGTGLASAHPWPSYAVRDYPRVGFLLLNQSRHEAIMPLRQVPSVFPQGADAIVLGCERADYLDARLILFPDSDTAYLTKPLSEPCN